jgi:hypothetical protein
VFLFLLGGRGHNQIDRFCLFAVFVDSAIDLPVTMSQPHHDPKAPEVEAFAARAGAGPHGTPPPNVQRRHAKLSPLKEMDEDVPSTPPTPEGEGQEGQKASALPAFPFPLGGTTSPFAPRPTRAATSEKKTPATATNSGVPNCIAAAAEVCDELPVTMANIAALFNSQIAPLRAEMAVSANAMTNLSSDFAQLKTLVATAVEGLEARMSASELRVDKLEKMIEQVNG